jgi:hypothetical protein
VKIAEMSNYNHADCKKYCFFKSVALASKRMLHHLKPPTICAVKPDMLQILTYILKIQMKGGVPEWVAKHNSRNNSRAISQMGLETYRNCRLDRPVS